MGRFSLEFEPPDLAAWLWAAVSALVVIEAVRYVLLGRRPKSRAIRTTTILLLAATVAALGIRGWLKPDASNHGWAILGEGDDALTFYTSEWGSLRHRPKLIVQCKAVESQDLDTGDVDTGAPEPPPITVRRIPDEEEEGPDEPPPSIPLLPPDDAEYKAVTGCQCRAAPQDETSLLQIVALLFS